MTETVIARRYATALFSLGQKHGDKTLAERGQCLKEIAEMLDASPELVMLFKSPVVSVAEKKNVLNAILEKMPSADTVMRNFCFLLADKERLDLLRSIAHWHGFMIDNANGILRGKVITAVSLTPAKQKEIKETLIKKAGSDMELTFSVDPEILGGMILAVGDRVLDSSLRAQLGILRENLKKGI